ncbi:MAG: OmpA family protein [Syntrophaceae bacterium]|nr:OmpA family protein [Syntrophaceae bacterium]
MMNSSFTRKMQALFLLFLGSSLVFLSKASAATTPTMIIEEAKFAIDQARRAGADKEALDDLVAARSWLSQAEKEYEAKKGFLARLTSSEAKDREIIYLGTMAKLKAQTAEAKAKKVSVLTSLKDSRRELSDYQNAVEVMKKKLAEVEKAREIQAKAEEERKALEEVRRKAAELEEQKKRELLEAQRRAAELEALKQKEIQASRLEESARLAQKERELAEAKLKAEQMAAQQAREAAELKAKEERLTIEREKLVVLQKKAEALAREKTMLSEAGKIPRAVVKAGDQEIVITLLAINLFTPSTEISESGQEILDQVGTFLKKYPEHKIVLRGHTDSTGSESANRAISEKRAAKVRDYLVAYQNLNPSRVTSEGLGPSQPVASNATEAGRALNRRVEIAVQTGE